MSGNSRPLKNIYMKADWQNKQKEFIIQKFAKLTKQFLTESERKLVSVDFDLID